MYHFDKNFMNIIVLPITAISIAFFSGCGVMVQPEGGIESDDIGKINPYQDENIEAYYDMDSLDVDSIPLVELEVDVPFDGFDSRTEDQGDIGIAKQGLEYTQILTAGNFHHGGNLWANSFPIGVGGPCHQGYVRDSIQVFHSGAGSCQWYYQWFTNSATDCTGIVWITNGAGFGTGDCWISVMERRSHASCKGYCGGWHPDGCACDPHCGDSGSNECCYDYESVCKEE